VLKNQSKFCLEKTIPGNIWDIFRFPTITGNITQNPWKRPQLFRFHAFSLLKIPAEILR